MGLNYLIGYATIICIITLRVWIKKENFIYCSLWTVNAVSGVFCVLCKVYQDTLVGHSAWHDRWYDLSDTTWWGYLFLIICCWIAYKPFKNFNKSNTLEKLGENRKTINCFVIFSYIFICLALLFILTSLNGVKSTLGINDFGALRSSLFSNGENEGSGAVASKFIANVALKLCIQFKYLSIFTAFTLIKEKKRTPLAVLLLFITFFVYYVNCAASAARGGMLIFLICSGLIGSMFFKYLSRANKVKIFIAAGILFGMVFVFFMVVTISRFANDGGGGNPILRNISFYLGHGPIEFSKVTGSLKEFAYGKTIIGRLVSHYFGTPYSWTDISDQIGFPQIGAVFVTFLGYMYTDFGIIGCILFVTIWSRIMNDILRKRPNNISTFFFFSYYLHYYVTGVFTIGRLEYASLITTTIIYLIIRAIELDPRVRSLFTLKFTISGR